MEEKEIYDDGTANVIDLLEKLQEQIVNKEGEKDRNIQTYIANGNCRIDNLYKLAAFHGFRLFIQHPITKNWHTYGDKPHELVKQVCFLFVEQNENYSAAVMELGLTKKTLDNWCQLDNYPLMKAFLKLAYHLGFKFMWMPETRFCKTCKYSMSFPSFPQLNLCWNSRAQRNRISLDDPACENYKKLKIGE